MAEYDKPEEYVSSMIFSGLQKQLDFHIGLSSKQFVNILGFDQCRPWLKILAILRAIRSMMDQADTDLSIRSTSISNTLDDIIF